jgi:hypothetical protein
MPKITPWEDKEAWYVRAERGESVAKMARESRKDPRTLQRGIDDVRRHRTAQEARETLLRESLRRHLEDLLSLLDRAVRIVDPPPVRPDLRFSGVEPPQILELGPVRVGRQGCAFGNVTLEVEQEFIWALLKEHLGRSHEFRLLGRWKKAFLAALNSHLEFREYLVITFRQDLELTLGEDIGQVGTIRPVAMEEVACAMVSRLLSEEPPYELRIEQGEGGEFLVNGLSGGRLSSDERTPQESFRSLLDTLMSSPSALGLVQANRRVIEETDGLREALELVRASYYLPGTCRACRRYGGV